MPASPSIKFVPLPRCPACATASQRPLFEIAVSRVVRCEECGLKFLNPCVAPEAMTAMYESDETLQRIHDYHEGYYEYGDLAHASKTLTE
jgi:hypothetical protein